jgi:hypothetical protein
MSEPFCHKLHRAVPDPAHAQKQYYCSVEEYAANLCELRSFVTFIRRQLWC